MANIAQLREQAYIDSQKKVRLFNPGKKDFTFNFNGAPHTIPAMEIKEFDFYVARHLKKHLAEKLLDEENVEYKTPHLIEEKYKLIEVTI